MTVFKSGAFVQQCFAVHPLALLFKVFSPPDKIGILCAQCNMRHRLTVKICHLQGRDGTWDGAAAYLDRCGKSHAEDLRVTEVDIEQDSVHLRCRTCQWTYQVSVSLFETCLP